MDERLSPLFRRERPCWAWCSSATEQIVDGLLDFSPYPKRPEVLGALRLSAAKRDDAAAFQSAFSKFDQ